MIHKLVLMYKFNSTEPKQLHVPKQELCVFLTVTAFWVFLIPQAQHSLAVPVQLKSCTLLMSLLKYFFL